MKKRLRNQWEEFAEYNLEFRRLSAENFAEKKKKDIVSFWIRSINFELYFMETSGFFEYNSSKLSYGLDGIKLNLKELTSEELDEVLNYYWSYGYVLNQKDKIVFYKPELIVIDWNSPNRQSFGDKIYLLKFKFRKFKKLLSVNKQENSFFKSIVMTIKDFYWYYFFNHSYCISATKLYKKCVKSKKLIERRNNIKEFVTKIKQSIKK